LQKGIVLHIGLITDTHFGVRGDSREFQNHMVRFYREVFWPEMKKRGISKVFHLGDIVDRRKFINFVTLNTLRKEFIEEAENLNIDLHIIVGNHDIPYRNTNEINAIKETCSRYNHIHLYEEPREIIVDNTKILMMPWINNTNIASSFKIMEQSDAQIMFGHLEIAGFEMYKGLPSHEGYDPTHFDKFDIVASGHFHKKSTNGNIHYLGAPYEMTWSDYDCPRGFHIFDTDTRTFEYIKNPLHMFHKIWYNDEGKTFEELQTDFSHIKDSYVKVIVQEKTNAYWFDLFMGNIYKAGAIDVSIVDDHKNMQELSDEDIVNNAEDTPTILSKYVANLDTKQDKTALDKLMRTLYDEAMSLEVE